MISILVPVYNEEDSLPFLHSNIGRAAEQAKLDLEIVLVDDGSRDPSWKIITELTERDSRVARIRLRRNFGKAAALSARFQAVRGEIVVTLDADLQNDPAEIPSLLRKLNNGLGLGQWLETQAA